MKSSFVRIFALAIVSISLSVALPLVAQSPVPASQPLLQMNGAIASSVRSGIVSGPNLLSALRARRDLVKKALRDDPANARSYMLDDSTRSAILAADSSAEALLEHDAVVTGELVGSVADDFEHGTSTTLYTLHTVDRDLDLSFVSAIPNIESLTHRQVALRGIALEEVVAVESLLRASPEEMEECAAARSAAISPFVAAADAAPASCSTTGVQRIAVLIVTFPGTTTAFPTGLDQPSYWNNIFTGPNPSVNGFFSEVSYGQTSATATVFGPFALSQLYDCNSTTAMANAAIAAAAASGTVDFTQFNRYVVVFPATTCYFGGLGNLGCLSSTSTINHQYSTVWIPITPNYTLTWPQQWGNTAHELGHNLGLGHSNTLDFGSGSLGPLDFVPSNPGTVSSPPPPEEESTAAGAAAPIGAVNTEYGDAFAIMGNGWNNAGPYSAEHRSNILGWIPKTDEADVASSGAFTLAPAENSTGLRTLRVLRDPTSASWVWLEFHQPTGFYTPNNMAAKTQAGNTLTSGALVRYETGNLDSKHTFLLDMTPSAVSNNFLDGTLAPGKSWSDPYSLLTLTAGTQTSSSLGVTVSYDKPCASLALSASELSAAGGTGNLTITAPQTCSWTASSNASWISFTGATSGSGNATVPFAYAANTGTSQRNSYITAQRQSLPVVQDGSNMTLVSVSPVQGSGSSQSFVVTATDALGPADFWREYFALGNCEVVVVLTGTTTNAAALYLMDTNIGTYSSGIVPGSSSTASIPNCSLYGQGSSVVFNGNQMVATLALSFSSSFNGAHSLLVGANTNYTGSNLSVGPLPLGVYTVKVAPAAATPVISPSGGSFSSAQSVSITDSTSGASIYYTTDGSTPTTGSTAYTKAITVAQTETINAIATASGYSQSAVATAAFTITGPAIAVTPATPLAFGSVTVGTSATGNFTVQNTGTGTLTGTASVAAPFSITSGASYNLAAGASQTVAVKFSPVAIQSYSQTVTFTGAAGAAGTVTGTGSAAPAITVTPATAVAFGSVTVGSSATQNFTVQNTGGGTLTGTASVAAPFSITSGASYSLAAGASQTVTVKFTPAAAQSYSQTVTFTGGAGATGTVTGTGVAAPAITVTPATTLAFGTLAIGSSSTQNFTVQNTGGGTLTGTASVTGWFSITSGASYSLAAGASQTVAVKFAPGGVASYLQTVTFTGGGGTTRTVTGTGVPAMPTSTTKLTATPNPSSFQELVTFTATVTVQTGISATGTVTFKNGNSTLGTVALSNNSAAFTFTALPQGTNSITAVYSGDTNIAGSTSNTVSQTVTAEITGDWTWMGGSNTTGGNGGQPGVYGPLGVLAAGEVPGSREAAVNWTDSNGNLWLFGGFGIDGSGNYGILNDLWVLSPTTNDWAWMGGSATVPVTSSGNGGQPGVYGTLGTPDAGNIPGSRIAATSWTDSSGNLWLFGGAAFDVAGNYGELNDLWEFSPSTNQWTWVGGSSAIPPTSGIKGVYGKLRTPAAANVPGGRQGAISWADSTGHFWLFGGTGYDSAGVLGNLNDLWEFYPATKQWAWMAGSSTVPSNQTGTGGQPGVYSGTGTLTPGGRNSAKSWTDSSGNLWLFGGQGWDSSNTYGLLNDLWEFKASTNAWVWLGGSSKVGSNGGQSGVYRTPGANAPGGRYLASSWTDASGNFWLFGGWGYDDSGNQGDLNDLWALNVAANQWSWMGGSSTVPSAGFQTTVYGSLGVPSSANVLGGRDSAVSWTDHSGNLWLLAGEFYSNTSSAWYQPNDLWEYQPAALIQPVTSTPTFSVPAGNYATTQTVTITDTTPGATIYYTLNGTTPTIASSVFSSAISVSATETIEAMAVAPGYSQSAVATAAYTITKVYLTPAIKLTTSSATAAYGASVTLTATLTGSGPSKPTGTVTFFSGTTMLGTAPLNSSAVAAGTVTSLAVGANSITASYSGDTNYSSLISAATTVTISKASQTITFTAPATPVTYGVTPITISATASSGLPVAFSVSSGPATISGNTLTITGAGTVTVAANQTGDGNYAAATAVTKTITVNKAASTVSLASSSSTISYGTAVTLTATLTNAGVGSVVPSGSVSFLSGTSALGSGTLDSKGVATLVLTTLPVGADSLTASYGGDGNYASSKSSAVTVTVSKTAQTISFTAPTSPVNYGVSPVALSATASSGLPVAFTVTSGPATVSGSTLTITGKGTVVVTANQAGSANYAAATAVQRTIVVNPGTVTSKLTSSSATVAYGASVTLTASLTGSGSAKPSGTVTFLNGATTLGTGTLNSSGTATLATTTLPVGSNSIIASYPGDTIYGAVTSAPLVETVQPAAPTVKLTTSASTAAYGASVTLTATLTGSGSAKPSGSVTFVNGSTAIGTGTLNSSGVATLAVSSLPVGAASIKGAYGGDSNYSAATSTAVTVTVTKAAQTISFTAPASPVTYGIAPVTLVATASSSLPVTFTVTSGPATLSNNTLTITGAGTVVVAANQAGNSNVSAATAVSKSITVNKATPPTNLQSSATTIAPNASVTFTATLAGVAAGAVPTGSVTFLDGTATLGSSITLAKGVGAYSTTKLALGKHTITVKYAGDGNYLAATSASVSVTVAAVN